MSEWRTRVADVPWRVGEKARTPAGDTIYPIEAKVWPDAWEQFAVVDMDCAGEGWGKEIAARIVEQHNLAPSESDIGRYRQMRAVQAVEQRRQYTPLADRTRPPTG